jgi:SPP1 family predicted phage head-tail adaptor
VKGTGGARTETYAPYAEGVPAHVRPLTGKEAVEGNALQSETVFFVRLRYRADVEPTDRVLFDGRTLEIKQAINPDMRRKMLELTCEAQGTGV